MIPRAITRAIASVAEASRDVRIEEIKAMDKIIALLAVKDPIAFQQVQAMNLGEQYTADYDPSDEGEIARIHDRLGELDDTEERMTDAEHHFLDDIFPGSGFAGRTVE